MSTLYLARHATPDWSRTDIRYDIPPGPPLTASGEAEALKLGVFLKQSGVQQVYYSPLERTARTAQIITQTTGILIEERLEIAEWQKDESEDELMSRFWPFWKKSVQQSQQMGPIAWVTHAGPIGLLLLRLGMDSNLLEKHRHLYDYTNPLPPAGVWQVQRSNKTHAWRFELAFNPRS